MGRDSQALHARVQSQALGFLDPLTSLVQRGISSAACMVRVGPWVDGKTAQLPCRAIAVTIFQCRFMGLLSVRLPALASLLAHQAATYSWAAR